LSPIREQSFTSVAFSRDGLLVAAGAWHTVLGRGGQCTAEVDVWSIETGIIQHTLARAEDGGGLAVSFSPVGQTVAGHAPGWASLGSGIQHWDSRSGRLLWASPFPPSSWAVSPVFFPDGRSLVACDGEAVRVLNAESGVTKRILMRVTGALKQPHVPAQPPYRKSQTAPGA